MQEVTKCINGHPNPNDAQYCGICGAPISRDKCDYTPGLYPDVHLVPVSVKKIKFIKGIEVFSIVFTIIIIIVCLVAFEGLGIDVDKIWEDMVDDLIWLLILLSIIAVLLVIGVMRGLSHFVNSCIFKHFADYIEETKSELARIAKAGKLGLFNQLKNKLLLAPRYEKIEKFDSKHILIGKDRFLGLYSIPQKKVIIPVTCDTISPEKDGIIEVSIKGSIQHFDILGNRLH